MPSTPEAVRVIRREHGNIDTALAMLEKRLADIEAGVWEPDFGLLADVLEYMATFPDAFHHPKEDRYLFAALDRRLPALRPALDRLRSEHSEAALLLDGLRAALAAFRADAARFDQLRNLADHYVAFQRSHMQREESVILPAALESLTSEDWERIGAAFGANGDPLFGPERARRFDRLMADIVGLRLRRADTAAPPLRPR